jgi:Protein of unknown function (DUF2924)
MAAAAIASNRGAAAEMENAAIDLAETLARLSAPTIFELRGEWRRLHRMPPPMRLSRDLLMRGITYKLQERLLGGLSQSLLRKLECQTIGSEACNTAWHVDRSACKPYSMRFAPRYKIENGQPVLKGACYEEFGRVKEWLHSSAAYRWLIDLHWAGASPDDVELYLQVILTAINFAKAKYDAAVIVLYLESNRKDKPYLRGTGFTTEAIIQHLRDGGATVIDASLDKEQAAGLALSIPGDGHPTGLANRLRATILKNYLEQNMPEVLASSLN